jgi:hypothetical protein
MSWCRRGQPDHGIIAQRRDGFEYYIAPSLDRPFIVAPGAAHLFVGGIWFPVAAVINVILRSLRID